MATNKTVVGIATSRVQAELIAQQLQAAGFASSDISALFPDTAGPRAFAHEQNTKAPEGAVAGVGAGGAVGGTLGLLAGIGALAIPGLGPFIAAGPIMAALSGAAAGAALGGVGGALIGMGIPELEAKQYEGKLREGNILLSVHVEDDNQRKVAKRILDGGGVDGVASVGEAKVPSKDRDERRA